MRNLFFVHTPVQMYIAQQLIHQEHLHHNILLYGYIDNNKHFVDTYNLLKIDSIWEKSIFFENLPSCVDLTLRRPITCFASIINNVRKLDSVIKNENIDNIYIGDIDNIGYQFLMFYYNGKVKVNIYEEGTSHYSYKNRIPYKRRFQALQECVLDVLFYKPLFGFEFSKYWYREGDYKALPMDSRYSILPGYNNESFDRLLTIDSTFQSHQLMEYLSEEIENVSKHSNVCFLITSKIYEHQEEHLRKERYSAYIETINSFAETIPKGTLVIVKLHPREGQDVATDVGNIFKNHGLSVYFLSKKISIPAEIFLQVLKPTRMTVFMNSTSIYNGYMYPKCDINDLIFDFFDICKKRAYYIDDLLSICNN